MAPGVQRSKEYVGLAGGGRVCLFLSGDGVGAYADHGVRVGGGE